MCTSAELANTMARAGCSGSSPSSSRSCRSMRVSTMSCRPASHTTYLHVRNISSMQHHRIASAIRAATLQHTASPRTRNNCLHILLRSQTFRRLFCVDRQDIWLQDNWIAYTLHLEISMSPLLSQPECFASTHVRRTAAASREHTRIQ